jgi:hypothetical protein
MPALSPSVQAGLLLAAIPVLIAHGLPAPSATAVLNATGASRTTAYKARSRLDALVPDLLPPPGRPAAPAPPPLSDTAELHGQVLAFIFDHAGAVAGSPERRKYSDRFRLFVIELCETYAQIPLSTLAQATGVPLPTLKDWLRGERPQVTPPETLAAVHSPGTARVETVLAAWKTWDGGFRAFCEHVSFDLRIPIGRQHIADLLAAHGVRVPKRRGRDQDAAAMRGAFETFFPGAQWVGDGAELTVHIGSERFSCNLELMVDADSGAFIGASVRPTEDAAAVTAAFRDGTATTGAEPLALLLDNKPSNHGEDVDAALDETLRIRSRPYVPTDKPHVEGAFGLFAQEAPNLAIHATTREEFAREVARLCVTTWARAVNHRPRANRNGKSRTQLYLDAKPTPEEIVNARDALQERQRKQEKARENRARAMDPVVRAALDAAFERLDLADPDSHLRVAIARWPLDAILAGIAIFEGKRLAGTLPEGADARYLRGIVKNLSEEAEGWQIAEALLRERLTARDLALAHLDAQREHIEEEAPDPEALIKAFVDKALVCARRVDRWFWLLALVDVVSDDEPARHRALLRVAARRIHHTRAVPYKERLAATRFLFAKAVPIG